MVDRKISKGKFGVALLITLMIFTIGILIGLLIEEKRLDYVQSISNKQNIEYNSLQTQYLYVSLLADEKNCPTIINIFNKNLDELGRAQKRFEEYHVESSITRADFNNALREYLLAEIRYWLLAKKTKELCSIDTDTILYFYIGKESCVDCNSQGYVLDYLKGVYKDNLLIFSFNMENTNEPMVFVLKDTYNITKYPALVINDRKFEGLTSQEDIIKELE